MYRFNQKGEVMKEKIEKVMQGFNFEEVYQVMKLLDWQWKNTDNLGAIPGIDRLKATARMLLEEVAEDDRDFSHIGTGGFYATKEDGELSLEFLIEYFDSEE